MTRHAYTFPALTRQFRDVPKSMKELFRCGFRLWSGDKTTTGCKDNGF